MGKLLLLYLFLSSGYCDDPVKQKAQPRKDSYDSILRPPPPPPAHLMRVHHHSHGQPRFQRQPRQPFHPGPPPFHNEKNPNPENQSIFQKITSWMFPENKEKSNQNRGPPPPIMYGPPPIYGVPFNIGPPVKIGANPPRPAVSGSPPPTFELPSAHPPPTFNTHDNAPQGTIVPHETYGPPPTDNTNFRYNPPKKICNPCNLYPWIPVLNYHTQAQKSPVGDQLTFNTNSILSPSVHTNGNHAQPLTTHLIAPPNIVPSPPSVYHSGQPFSLSNLELENNRPSFTKPLTNSYGTPIPSDTYGSPFPGTNDGAPFTIDINKENLQHVESNNVLQVSKPIPSQFDNSGKYVNHTSKLNGNNVPFTPLVINYDKGRNVQTLQPIPLPNLSPVPLPPLFNAKPFSYRGQPNTNSAQNFASYSPSANQPTKSSVQVLNSVPIAEFTSSVDYPITIVQSPLLDIDATKSTNGQENYNAEKDRRAEKNPKIIEQENTKPINNNFDSFSAASGGNDHEFDDSEREEVIYSTTEVYSTTEAQFLPTPVIHHHGNVKDEDFSSPSTIHTYVDVTPAYEEYKDTFTGPTTVQPYSQDYEEYQPNLFQPADPDQLQAIDSPLLYLSPNVPHKESEAFKGQRFKLPPTHNIQTTTQASVNNYSSEWKNAFRFVDNRAVPGRWPPPSDEVNGEPTKKPKRIQIIIPYTSQNKPQPFQFTANDVISSSGWIPMFDELGSNFGRKVPPTASNQNSVGPFSHNSLTDYHESSESKVVTSFNTSTVTPRPVYYTDTTLNSININTVTPKQEDKFSFDISKLQKNIDDWTVQEFSKVYKKPQKASTISHLKRSKKIPDEYFTTLPSVLKTSKALLSTINDLGSFFDNEAAGSFQHSVETDLNQPKFVVNVDNEIPEEEPVTITSRPTYYVSTTYPTTPYYRETTTQPPEPPQTTVRHSWEKILTSISPLTKEKVYVVTPLSVDLERPQESRRIVSIRGRKISNETESKKQEISDFQLNNNLSFKSPRFLVRPTPGPTGSQRDRSIISVRNKNSESIPISGIDWLHSINNLIETTTTESPSRSFFGLASVTAYTPPPGSTVQTYAGHSKVITVTPSVEDKKNNL